MYIKNPLIIKNAQLLTHHPCGNEYLQNTWDYLQSLMKIDPLSLSEIERINLLEERILNGDFKLYVQVVSEGKFKFDLVHDVIASFFLDLLFLKNDKSMLSLAPRHGKSALMTWLITYTFALNNGRQNGLYATYGKSLTVLFGRDIRDTFLNPVFLKLFPESKLSDTSRGAMDFATKNGGKFAGVSVGASCTGKGAGVMSDYSFPGGLIVDDGVKDMKSALSETAMESLAQWYSSEMSTRGNKYHFKLITATRYSLNDLHANQLGIYDEYTGTYSNEYDSENNPNGWRYLNIKAICDNEETDPLGRKLGEAAWPAVFDVEYLEKAKKDKGDFTFSALYMGNPTPKDGGIFKESWLSWCDKREVPKLSHVFVALDPAFGVLRDESVFTVCGVSAVSDELYILEQTGDSSWEFPDLISESKRLAKIYNPIYFIVESTASGKPLMQHFKRQTMAGQTIIMRGYPEKGTPLKNKQQKISQILPVFIDGKVICVRNPSWNYKLLEQIKQFPFAPHDDRIDSLAIATDYWILNLRKNLNGKYYNKSENKKSQRQSIQDLVKESRAMNDGLYDPVRSYNNGVISEHNLTPQFNW